MSDNFWAAKLAGMEPPPQTAPLAAWWSDSPAPPNTPPPQSLHLYQRPERYPEPRATGRDQGPSATHCPACNSGNFMQPSRNSQHRCFDCNYPNTQSFTGARVTTGTPVGKAVRQAKSPGFQPGTIIGRIG